MNKLGASVKIDPKFTWKEWQLFKMKGSAGVARALNTKLKSLVNSGKYSRDDITDQMHTLMSESRKFGAFDSEPRWFLEDILDEVYGV